MIFYESTSSTIIGAPQVERVNQLQLNQKFTPQEHDTIVIDGFVGGSEPASDHTIPTESYIKSYIENNITNLQNEDLSDTTSFLQIISAPLNGYDYHNFIKRSGQKTLNLNFTATPLKFFSEGEVYTCKSNLNLTIPDTQFSAELYAKFNYRTKDVGSFNKYSTMFSSVLATQTGWVSSNNSGSPQLAGDFCVAFPSNRLNTDIEYTFISAQSGNTIFLCDQFFDTPRGQFVDLQNQKRTSAKLIPTTVCKAYRLIYLFVVNTDGVWSVVSTKTKPVIFNKKPSSTTEGGWYFDNMSQCWYIGRNNGLKKQVACFVGIVACNSSSIVAAWNMPPAQLVNPYNTVRLNQLDTTRISTVSDQNTVNIFNKKVSVVSEIIKPELNALAKSCQYYIYVDLNGSFHIDWMHPYENAYGEYYHLINYWKCVGEFFVDHRQNLLNVLDLHDFLRYDDNGEEKTLTYEFAQNQIITNPYIEYTDINVYPYCRHFFAPLNRNFAKSLSYYEVLFVSAGGNGYDTNIPDTTTYATITTSFNDLFMCLQDGKRGNVSSAGSNSYGRSNGTKYGSVTAVTSAGARSTCTLFNTDTYAKGGNSVGAGFGGNSGNACLDTIAVAQLPECFINFGTTQASTGNTLGYAKFVLHYCKDK